MSLRYVVFGFQNILEHRYASDLGLLLKFQFVCIDVATFAEHVHALNYMY